MKITIDKPKFKETTDPTVIEETADSSCRIVIGKISSESEPIACLEVTRGDRIQQAELGADDEIVIQFQARDDSRARQLLRNAYDIVVNSDQQDAHPNWLANTRVELGLKEAHELIDGSIYAQVMKSLAGCGIKAHGDTWIMIETSGDSFYFYIQNNRWMIRRTHPTSGADIGEAIPLFATDFTKFVPIAKDVTNEILDYLLVGQFKTSDHPGDQAEYNVEEEKPAYQKVADILKGWGFNVLTDDYEIMISTSGDTFYFCCGTNKWKVIQVEPKTGKRRIQDGVLLFNPGVTCDSPTINDVANTIVEFMIKRAIR